MLSGKSVGVVQMLPNQEQSGDGARLAKLITRD
jgi:hypothetical protein